MNVTWVEQLQTANWGQATICALGAYVLGCFTTGYYLVRAWTGKDIRDMASGSVGARNVGRVLGKTGFLLTTFGDFGKGVLAVWAALRFTGSYHIAALAILAVLAGHVWPFQLQFRGGKGVAASLGALLAYDWQLAATYAIFFAAGFALTRRTVFPGLFAYAVLPLASFWLDHNGVRAAILGMVAAVIWFAHRQNIVEEIPALAARRGLTPKPEQPKL